MTESIPWGTRSRTAAALGPPLLAVATGVVLGLASGVADQLPWYAGGLLNIAGPWLAVAFALGALAPRAGPLNGMLALAVAVTVYYWFHIGVTQRTDTERLIIVGSAWMTFAVAVGGLTGLIGGWWAARRSPIPVGLLAGALAGEAVLGQMTIHDPAGRALIATEMAVAVVLPLVLLPGVWRRVMAYAVAVAAGGVTMIAIQVVDEYLATIRG